MTVTMMMMTMNMITITMMTVIMLTSMAIIMMITVLPGDELYSFKCSGIPRRPQVLQLPGGQSLGGQDFRLRSHRVQIQADYTLPRRARGLQT